jgi:hypothetical protein
MLRGEKDGGSEIIKGEKCNEVKQIWGELLT